MSEDAKASRDATELMLSGAAIAVLGAVGAAVSGAVCPVCVVAAPALLGVGAFRRSRATRVRCQGAPRDRSKAT